MSAEDHGAADGSMISLGPGSRIAGYLLEERIGQGGMAVVFKAHDERLDRRVALKVLAPTLAGDARFQRRFISESRAAATIDDPHIVPVFAAGQADGTLFIAMRYVTGGDAQSLLNREGPLPPGRVAAIISPVASALDTAHRSGLVHRDVKPSNMLMDVLPGRPDHVYLSDFGLTKSVASTSGETAAGTVMGTLAYMSPEQVGAQPVDGQADQYALACSAFELLTGAPPFRRDDPAAVMYAHLAEPPPRLSSRRPGLPPAVDDVLSRALAKVPGERYASCGQFADALRDALGLSPYRPGPRVPADVSTPAIPDTVLDVRQARRRRGVITVFAAAALVMAAAGLTAGLLAGSAAQAPTVPISLKSAQPAVTGDVYVVYLGGKQANAEVYGQISTAANGEVAKLYAQPFPYRDAPAQAGSVVLHPAGSTARYEFPVTPARATRYRVELFHSGTSLTPFATSGIATVYVALGTRVGRAKDCGSGTCYESLQTTFTSPPSALQAELSKPLYTYFAVRLAPKTAPPTPTRLVLRAGHSQVVGVQRISADQFIETVTFSFQFGNGAYSWAWGMCLKDSEAVDGIGLPGHHGCGDQGVPYPTPKYLG